MVGFEMKSVSLWAKFVLYIGLIALLALPVGALGTRFGAWSFGLGFQFLFGGCLLAVVSLVLGAAAFIRAALRNRPADRLPAIVGVAASVFVLAWMGQQFLTATSLPGIHNISTDPEDPPAFDAIVALRGPGTNALEYDPEDAAAQAAGYPDLATLRTSTSPQASLERAAAIARGLGWEVVNEDAEQGIVEATETTFWFGFKDDVVVRIRPDGDGASIDLRSVSRVGQGDLGANARRIALFLERFEEGGR